MKVTKSIKTELISVNGQIWANLKCDEEQLQSDGRGHYKCHVERCFYLDP